MDYYTEKTFCIDLISEHYKTVNPEKIVQLCKEILDVELKISDVLDYLNLTEDFEKESRFIQMKDIFNT